MEEQINIIPLEFGMSNFELTYLINEVGKSSNKEKLSSNMIIASMLDDKMYYKENNNIPTYQHNNIVLINNEKDIIPLSFNIKNINSALTIEGNEILFKIDNNTIKEKDNKLIADYNNVNLADHNPGIFKPDGDSMIIENDKITLSNNIKDIMNNINSHIDIMNSVINQSSSNLDNIIGIYKEYTLYDKKYSCNTNIKYPIYYSDETNNNIEMSLIKEDENNINIYHSYFIDYYKKYFKLKIKFVYNYQSSSLPDFNPFNENNINIEIKSENNSINIKDIIKFNKNKSYIYNSNVNYFDEDNNNVYGEVNYICYFNIDNDILYDYVKNYNGIIKNIEFDIKITYNDTKIDSESFTNIKLNLFIDDYKDKHIHKIIYHNYDVGFNYEGIGNMVGICMYENDNNSKPIFIKYFNNEDNYIINNISNDILYNELEGKNNIIINFNSLQEFCEDNTINLINFDDTNIYYRNIDLMNKFINSKFETLINKKENEYINQGYKFSRKYCFNSTYNIYGNGLKKGDCYIPSIKELILFYVLGFYFYISYIDNNLTLYSSSFCQSNTPNTLEVIGIDGSNISNGTISLIRRKVNTIQLLDNKEIVPVYNNDDMIYKHHSISLFKLPDYSILNGYNYYVSYDIENNCEVIDYMTKKDIKLRIKCYNKSIDNIYEISKRISFYCKDDNVKVNLQYITQTSENIYELTFNLIDIISEYNDIDIYYKDSDEFFNKDNIKENEYYRRICRISVKNII